MRMFACLRLALASAMLLAVLSPAQAGNHCYRPQHVQALQVQQRVCPQQQVLARTTVIRQQVLAPQAYYQPPQIQRQVLLQQSQPQQVLLQQAPQMYYQPRQVLQPTQQLQLTAPNYGCNGGQTQGFYYYQPQQQQAVTLPDTAPTCPQCQSQANLTLADTAGYQAPQQALTLADTAPSYPAGYAVAAASYATGYTGGYQRTVLADTAAPGYAVSGQQVLLLQQRQHAGLLARLHNRHTVAAQFAPAPQQLVLAQDAGGYGVAGGGSFQQINVNTGQRRGLLSRVFSR